MTEHLPLILAAVAAGFLLKSIAGFGGPLFAVPILAPTLGVEHAVVAVSFANIVANLLMLWEYRSEAPESKPLLARLLAGGAIGTAVGTWLLTWIDDRPISLAVGILVLAYIATALRMPELHIPQGRGLIAAVPVGLVGGVVHGATGNSGQIFGTFIHALGLPRRAYVWALTVVFFSFGTVQTITLFGLGSFDRQRIIEATWAIIPVFVVIPLGTRIAARLKSTTFRWVVLGALALAGIRLIVSAL
jgi:uncharacterized protein